MMKCGVLGFQFWPELGERTGKERRKRERAQSESKRDKRGGEQFEFWGENEGLRHLFGHWKVGNPDQTGERRKKKKQTKVTVRPTGGGTKKERGRILVVSERAGPGFLEGGFLKRFLEKSFADREKGIHQRKHCCTEGGGVRRQIREKRGVSRQKVQGKNYWEREKCGRQRRGV